MGFLLSKHEFRIHMMKKFCKLNKLNASNLSYIIKYATQGDLKELREITELSDWQLNLNYLLIGYIRYLIDHCDIKEITRDYTTMYHSGYLLYSLSKDGRFSFKVNNLGAYKCLPKDIIKNGQIDSKSVEYQIMKIVTMFKFEETVSGDRELTSFLHSMCIQLEDYCVSHKYFQFWGRPNKWRLL